MSFKYLQEITSDWKTDFKMPNHTYIMNGTTCVGYIKEGTTEEIMFNHPSKNFDKRYRKFKNVTKQFN